MNTFSTPDGRILYPYNYARISFGANVDGEWRTGFCFALGHEADAIAAHLEDKGARCLIGRTVAIEMDEECGWPDFRSWVNALDNCDSARRIGSQIVVLWAR